MIYLRLFILCISILISFPSLTKKAHASYPSCAEVNGTSDSETGTILSPNPSDPVTMQAGDQITFTWVMTETGGFADQIEFSVVNMASALPPTILSLHNIAAYGSISPVVTFTATEDGVYGFAYAMLLAPGMTTLNTTISTSCLSVGIAKQSHQDAVQSANQVSNTQQQQTNNLVTSRIRQLSKKGTRTNAPNGAVPEFRSDTSGQNAGAPDYGNGLWGNLALTHSQDRHQASAYSGIQGSAVIGLDTRMADSLLMGAAINMEYATLSRNNNQMQFSSSGLGLSPYISYQIDDIFSLSSLANITYTNNHSGFDNGTKIDQGSVRWNFAVQGDVFWNWDNWGLLAGLGLSYGQTHLLATKDNNGIDVTGQTTRLGTAQLTLQPSYYWQYDNDLGLEPYLLSQYNYDYSMTKIRTSTTEQNHPNDQDSFRLGIGMNLFGSSFYSGNIEASTVLGRDDYSEASISGNIRIQF